MLFAFAGVQAQESVTFDFTSPSTLSPSFTKPASSAGVDIEGTVFTNGVASFTATDGSTNTRIWNASGNCELRVYKTAVITISVPEGYVITNVSSTGTTIVWSVDGKTRSVSYTATGTLKIKTVTVTYEASETQDPEEPVVPEEPETPEPEPEDPKVGYTLVTSINDLSAGDNVVIVATNANVALSTTQNGNNRGSATVAKSDNIVTFGDDVQVMTLEAGSVSGTFAFNTGNGYLHAASSGSNYLRTEATLSANSSWNITIANTGVATIKAQGNYTRNWLRYNSQSSIFSCYASGQADVSIYKLYEEGETPAETVDAPVLPASTTFNGSYEVTITAGDGVAIYYTLDGNEPTKESTLYEGPFTITETTTVKAIAVKNELVSTAAVATYKLVKTLNNCTVAELMDAYASGDEIAEGATVVGYIVGAANNSLNKAEFGTTSVESNILLADDPYETNVENCIPVEIKNDVRTALNLANNPDNYQKKVILTGNVEAYFSVAGLKSTSAYEFVEMFYNTITVSDAGWATLYLPTTARIPSNVEAYTVTTVNDGWVTLTQVKGVIPANTGIIVKANAGEYELIVSETATADVTGNLLSGSAFPKNIEEEAYVLGKVDGVVGLYKAEMTDGVWLNNANKAYLPASALTPAQQTAAFYGFDWNGTTGIDEITENRVQSTVIYDLTGRRVEEITEPGIYIVNGKKVLVK